MRITAILTFLLSTIVSNAQTASYQADLAALKSILQKTPSYKAQIRGSKQAAYNALYQRLAADTLSRIDNYKYFYNLAQLLFPLRDNHLGFYQLPDYEHFKTRARIDSFVTTEAFAAYPACAINTDSLKAALSIKPADAVEGIYYYDKYYTVGLFKSGDKEYTGVVVDSDVSLWQKGQIAMRLYAYGPNRYKAIYGHPLTKNLILQQNEKFENQALVNSYFYGAYSPKAYSKQQREVDFVNLPAAAPAFELKNINSEVQYLLVRTFQANKATMQRSSTFYDSVKHSLAALNLVVDLRNNAGGAWKEARKFFKLIKSHRRKGNVYILLNNGTLSQAEILTLRLKRLNNITTVGQTTKGMLTYGSNYGKREKLPSQNFEIYITDMKGKAMHLQYEGVGIEPQIYLNDNADWIEQLVEVINTKSKKSNTKKS